MVLKNYLKLSIQDLFQNKKNSLKAITIITFSFIFLILSISLPSSLKKFIDKNILNTIEHKTLMIEYADKGNKDIEMKISQLLKKEKSIVELKKYNAPITGDVQNSKEIFGDEKLNTLSLISGFNSEMPNIIKGKLFSKNDTNVGIIPEKFDPSSSNQVSFKKEPIDYLDGKKFLGKTITLKFTDPQNSSSFFEYSFKVIGIYDSVKNRDFPSDVYITDNDIEEIHKKYYKMMEKYYNKSDITLKTLIALIDEHKNMDKTIGKLNDEGKNLEIEVYPKAEVGFLETIYKSIFYIGVPVSIIFILIAFNTSRNTLQKTQEKLRTFKDFECKNNNLIKLITIKLLIVNFISFISSIIFSKLFFIGLNSIVSNYMSIYMQKLSFKIDSIPILIIILFILINIYTIKLKEPYEYKVEK